jgi:hypothetical protein
LRFVTRVYKANLTNNCLAPHSHTERLLHLFRLACIWLVPFFHSDGYHYLVAATQCHILDEEQAFLERKAWLCVHWHFRYCAGILDSGDCGKLRIL